MAGVFCAIQRKSPEIDIVEINQAAQEYHNCRSKTLETNNLEPGVLLIMHHDQMT